MPIPTALKVLSPITGLISAARGGGSTSGSRATARRGGAGSARPLTASERAETTGIPSYKRGGTMKKRGVAKLHKGEEIMGRKGGRKRGRGRRR